MADRLANFAVDSCTSVQVHLPSDHRVVKEVATFLDSDVHRRLANFHNELSDPRGSAATGLQLEQRTAAVRGLLLP